MSIRYKDRGVLHKLTSTTKFRPQQSNKRLIRWTGKTALAVETTFLFAKDTVTNPFRHKEFHIQLYQKVNRSGKQQIHFRIVRADSPQEKSRGIIHRVATLPRFIEREYTKNIKFKKLNQTVHKIGNFALKAESKVIAAEDFTKNSAIVAKNLVINRFVGKEYHINFERKQDQSGHFKTYAKLVRADIKERPKGLLHKIDKMSRFFEGDAPFTKKYKIRYIPKSRLGRLAYLYTAVPVIRAGKFTARKTTKAIWKTSLAAESAALKASSAGINHLRQKLRNSSDTLDGGKVVLTGLTALHTLNSARKYLIKYRIERKNFKQLKQIHQGQKLNTKKAKLHYKAERKIIRSDKKVLKRKLKTVSKLHLSKRHKPMSRVFRQRLRVSVEKISAVQNYRNTKFFYQHLIKSDRKKLKKYKSKQRSRIKAIKKISQKTDNHTSRSRLVQKVRVYTKLNKPKIFLTARITAAKIKLKQNKSLYRSKNKFRSAQIKSAKKIVKNHQRQKISQAKKIRKQKRKVVNSKIKYQKQLNKSEKKILKNQKKLKKISKAEMKNAKVVPMAALSLVPVGAGIKKLQSTAFQKVLAADPNNDFVQAIDKTAKIAKTLNNTAKPIKSKLKEKRIESKKNSLRKEQARLKNKNSNLRKNKRPQIKNNQKNLKEKAIDTAKKAAKQAKKAAGDFAKFAIKTFGIFLIPIIAIIIVFAMFMLTFTGVSGNSSYILGTYNAEDRYISYAVEHYTKIAYDFNDNILKCGKSDDWKTGLQNLGVSSSKLSSYKDTPNKYKFGKSDYFSQTPSYDFDPDKLTAFMCAYYYAPDKDGNVSNWVWEDSYDTVLQKLFDTEYEFKHHYEDYSGWKKLNDYVFFGGGGSGGEFYTIDSTDVSKSKMKIIGVPTEINKFCKDGYLHYNYNTLEVLNANDKDKQTGYFIQDQRYYVTDPNGHSSKPFFTKTYVNRSNVLKYRYSGSWTYLTDTLEILDKDGNKTGFYINDLSEKPYKFYKWTWKHGSETIDRSGWSWTDDRKEICYLVSSADTKKWNSTLDNTCLISFYQKNYWYDDCILYYTVNKKCTFEQAIISVIKSKGDETEARLNFYYTLTQKNKNGRQTYGNHQIMNAPVLSKSIQTLIDNKKIYNSYGYDMQEWNKKHCSGLESNHKGMDILANDGANVYAMFDGYIDWIDESKQSLSLKTSDEQKIEFWYCDNAEYPVEAIYSNIKASVKKGAKVKQGQIIGKVTKKKRCFDDWDISASKNYLHITIKIGYDKWTLGIKSTEWVEVDPRFLIYRNDGEAK